MKILIFSTAYFPHVGGAEVAVKEITDRIDDVSFSTQGGLWDMVTIRLSRKDAKQEKIGNINVYRIGWGLGKPTSPAGKIDKLLFPFRAARFANKLHQQNKYNIVWSIMASYSGFAALFFKKKNPDVKFLLTLQEGDDLKTPERKSILVHGWFKQIFTKADYIQGISNYLTHWAHKMGASQNKITVVPNGTNFRQVSEDKKEELKTKLNIKNEKIILTTSRLVAKNGIDFLIKATEMLTNNLVFNKHKVKLVICGNGELEDQLKKHAKDLNIEDKIIFTGFVQPKKLASYYAIADVFCRPSKSEGLGNSFLEAMTYSVPVVATPVGGIKDFLIAGKTGWFCADSSNPTASIAEKVKYILDPKNKEEVDQVIKNAKRLVEEKYNWDKIAPQMKNIFEKIS